MALVIHILIACSSLGFTSYVFFSPSQTKLRVAYSLIAATLTSGTLLLISTPSHIMEACMMGLVYTGVSLSLILAAHAKLATDQVTKR